MRILYVISGLGPGGAEKQVVELARELSARRHAVAIYALTRDVSRAIELAGSGVTLVVDPKRAKLDGRVLWRLRRMLRRWRPDVVHGVLYDGNFYARLAAFGSGIPVLNSERSNGYVLTPLQRIAQRLTRACADGVVANTYGGAAFAQRLFNLPSDRIHVVWNGIRIDELERRAESPLDYRAVFFGETQVRLACLVGSIRPIKDYRLALETAAHLLALDPRWRVLFIGDSLAATGGYQVRAAADSGSYKVEVLAHYARLGLEDRIRFGGLRDDVPAIVRQCDVLFVTSVNEGFPNVVLEAMALGVPVVSTDYSDIRRILPLERQVVATRDGAAMARAILWAASQREALAPRQRDWVRAHATIDRAAARLEEVYLRYVEARRMRVGRSMGAADAHGPAGASARVEHER